MLGLNPSFQPEFVNAYEVGTKNTLLDGSLVLNLTGFYYDYKGYQIARSVNPSIYNENIDATIKGLELESIWEPVQGLRLNANIGYLDTRIDEGQVVDTFNRTRGDATYVYGNSTTGGCVLNAAGVAEVLRTAAGPSILATVACSGPATLTSRLTAAGVPAATATALTAGVYNYGGNVTRYSSGAGEGVLQNLEGNQLPGSPKWTVALGAQYRWELAGGWDATLRGDYYRQSRSYMRYNNNPFDRVRGWENVNATLTFAKAEADLTVQLYVRNLLDDDTIVGFDINDENLGATRNIILLDPRLYGVMVTKTF
jgi:outer membrane receptor protein involved in Fe transport